MVALLALALGVGVYFSKLRRRVVTFHGEHLPAPEFSLKGLNGESVDFTAFRGKVVLLDFWATWCDPCREEIPRFVELQNEFGKQGLQIIGISMDDDPQPVRDFYRQAKMNYPVAMGDAKTGSLYGGVLGVPIAFMIGRDGRIYAKHVGATSFTTFDDEVTALLQMPPSPGVTPSQK